MRISASRASPVSDSAPVVWRIILSLAGTATGESGCASGNSSNDESISAKLHYTDTGYEHRLRTPPTDELATILQLVLQQIHHQRTKICHIPTSWHVEMLGSGIAMRQICCRLLLWVRPLVASFGGVVQHVRSPCPCTGVWADVVQANLTG